MTHQTNLMKKFNINREQILHLDSENIRIQPNCLYEYESEVEGIQGKKNSAFFAIIFLDEEKKEINRKIKYISDFSGNTKKYSIVAESPNKSKFAKLALRINSENENFHDDVIIKFPKLDINHLKKVTNKIENYDNLTDFDKFWKKFDKNCYRQIVMPKTKEDFQSIPNFYKEKFWDFNINYFEGKKYSQNGEDGILEFIFSLIGTTNKFFVEFGVESGIQCNSRFLIEKGWIGLMMDGVDNINPLIKKEFVTAENINKLFRKYNVPKNFDLLSIDIDYNDYWVWKAIEGYSPRVVVIEYNSTIPPDESLVVEYKPDALWDGTNYFGASLLALYRLGKSKGYTLVGCDNHGVNSFFIKDDIIKGKIKKKSVGELFRPPKFGKIINKQCIGHGFSPKKMIKI
jgi:hypothetical protein